MFALFRTALMAIAAATLAACATPADPTHDAPAYSAADTLTLERTRCYGFCPDYTVTINGEGAVTYNGRAFVGATGARTAQVDPAETARLFSRAEEIGFFGLRNEYRANVSDLPTATVTFVRNGERKSVLDYGGAMAGMPESVRQLQEQIDRVAGTAQWTANAPGVPPRSK